jgi:hypothetical protein
MLSESWLQLQRETTIGSVGSVQFGKKLSKFCGERVVSLF